MDRLWLTTIHSYASSAPLLSPSSSALRELWCREPRTSPSWNRFCTPHRSMGARNARLRPRPPARVRGSERQASLAANSSNASATRSQLNPNEPLSSTPVCGPRSVSTRNTRSASADRPTGSVAAPRRQLRRDHAQTSTLPRLGTRGAAEPCAHGPTTVRGCHAVAHMRSWPGDLGVGRGAIWRRVTPRVRSGPGGVARGGGTR
jgi:hypothetical protein